MKSSICKLLLLIHLLPFVALGQSNIETNEPVTTETLFQAGSISKPVAAMVARLHTSS